MTSLSPLVPNSIIARLIQVTPKIDLLRRDDRRATRPKTTNIPQHSQVIRAHSPLPIRPLIKPTSLDPIRPDQDRGSNTHVHSIPPRTTLRIPREASPDRLHVLCKSILLHRGVDLVIRPEDDRDLAGVVGAQVGERLSVGEAGIEVVPPGWDAAGGGVVEHSGLGALEGELGENLGDDVVGVVKTALALWVGREEGVDDCLVVAEGADQELAGVVLADLEDAAFLAVSAG